jgi:hypothetical protein
VSDEKGGRRVRKFAVTRWNQAGAPVYDTMPNGEEYAAAPPRFDVSHFADARWSSFLHQNPKTGQLYAAFNDWTRDWCDYADSFLHQWDPAGASTWTVGQRGVTPVLPGEVHVHLRGIAGIAHDCPIAIDVDGGWSMQHPAASYVWDPDGLYVGGLLDQPNLDGIEKHWYQCGGEFCHASVHTLPTGDVLLYANWENEVRIYRIGGWQGWLRQSGAIRLDQPKASDTGQGLLAVRYRYDGKAMATTIEPQVAASFAKAVRAVRWTGTLRPDYGPTYNGPWTIRGGKEYFDGSARASRDNDARVSFRFRGTSIGVFGATGPNCGFANIMLDSKPQPRFDCYSPAPRHNVAFFTKSDLPRGDHELTVTVVGWYGKPSNQASSDSWVTIDKFVVDGKDIDDAGIACTFFANADGKLRAWVNREALFEDKKSHKARNELSGATIKLLRAANPLQIDYTQGTGGGVTLFWSSPFDAKQPLPTRCLYPVIPGGYTMDNFRSPSRWPKQK